MSGTLGCNLYCTELPVGDASLTLEQRLARHGSEAVRMQNICAEK